MYLFIFSFRFSPYIGWCISCRKVDKVPCKELLFLSLFLAFYLFGWRIVCGGKVKTLVEMWLFSVQQIFKYIHLSWQDCDQRISWTCPESRTCPWISQATLILHFLTESHALNTLDTGHLGGLLFEHIYSLLQNIPSKKKKILTKCVPLIENHALRHLPYPFLYRFFQNVSSLCDPNHYIIFFLMVVLLNLSLTPQTK